MTLRISVAPPMPKKFASSINRHTRQAFKSIVLSLSIWLGLATSNAWADVVIVVNPSAPVKEFTAEDLRQIFLGRVQLFPGTNVNISVLDQKEGSQAYSRFYQKVAKMNPIKLTRYRASFLFSGRGRLPDVMSDDKAVLEAVRKNQAAIGYVQRESVTDNSVLVVMSLE